MDNYCSVIQLVPECFEIQETCDKAVNTGLFAFDYFPYWCKSQEICCFQGTFYAKILPWLTLHPTNVQ